MKIGIDLGGTNIAVAIVDGDFGIVVQRSVKTLKERHYTEIIRDMATLSLELVKEAGLTLDDIDSIGIGSPGVLDKDTGYVLYSNNIKWENVDLRGEFSKHITKPIFVNNDANCAALGEFIAGAARGYSSSLTVTLGTGVGGGLILNHKLYCGFNSAANSVGHATLISGGELCTCGRRGCWEAYASVTGLIRMAETIAKEQPESALAVLAGQAEGLNGKNIFEAAKQGDHAAGELVERYAFYVAEGITNLINILQPEVIVIGGGLCNEGDYLLDPVRARVKNDVFCKYVTMPIIKVAQLGNNAGIIGAAFLQDYQVE